MADDVRNEITGAEATLTALKANGVDYLFANAGTDFPSIIEAFARLEPTGRVPTPVMVPHETAAAAMAHGYYLASGRPQALMVHVNVGLANAAMGAINAASDNIPMLIMSGRTPITESGRRGSRVTPIQYGQEMYDQTSLVRDVCKFNYEMRYPEQGGLLVGRALSLAMSEPRGPVYVSLPREPLAETVPAGLPDRSTGARASAPAYPSPDAIAEIADLVARASFPLVICQRSDVGGRMAAALSRLANDFAIGVVEPFSVRNVMASADPMLLGYAVKEPLAEADLVIVLDSAIPWMESLHRPAPGKTIVHIGPDPLFQRQPVRSFQTDLAVAGDPAAALEMLHGLLAASGLEVAERRAMLAERSRARRERSAATAAQGAGSPMSGEWMSRCLGDALGEDGILFSELGVVLDSMDLKGPNRVFTAPHSGGLGWAMPAALGAQLARPERLTAACIGDGSYMFANPVACHQIAEALELPILTVIKNNRSWNAVRRSVLNAYPDGAAVKANRMPLTSLEPIPEFCQIAAASRAHVEKVERGEDLPAALERAIHVIRSERRQALLDLTVALSDAQ